MKLKTNNLDNATVNQLARLTSLIADGTLVKLEEPMDSPRTNSKLANHWKQYRKLRAEGLTRKQALKQLKDDKRKEA